METGHAPLALALALSATFAVHLPGIAYGAPDEDRVKSRPPMQPKMMREAVKSRPGAPRARAVEEDYASAAVRTLASEQAQVRFSEKARADEHFRSGMSPSAAQSVPAVDVPKARRVGREGS